MAARNTLISKETVILNMGTRKHECVYKFAPKSSHT